MRHLNILTIAFVALSLVITNAALADITYQSSDPGSASWFPTAAPVAGDLAQSATVTLVQGAAPGDSGPFSNLTNGSGGTGATTTSWFSSTASPTTFDKIQMDFGSNKLIGNIKTFSWQDFNQNDCRFPQIYTVYGSTAASPATDDATLSSPTWNLLATVDSTTVYAYSGQNTFAATPEQLAVTITGAGGSNVGSYRHLLFRIGTKADPDGGGPANQGFSTFWSEFDVLEAVPVPEPSSIGLIVAGACGLQLFRRRNRVRI